MKLKSILFSVIAGMSLSVICSCSGTKTESESGEEKFIVTAQDSTDVLAMASEVLELMHGGDIATASSKLYRIDPSTGAAMPSDDAQKRELEQRALVFPVLNYSLRSMKLDSPDENVISYDVEFAKAAEGDETPTVVMAFSPVKIDGKWYLTLTQRY